MFVRLCVLALDITLTFAAPVTQRQLFCPYIAISYGGFRKVGDAGQLEAALNLDALKLSLRRVNMWPAPGGGG